MHRLVMKNLVAQLSKDVVQREETRMPNSSTTFSKSTTWMPPIDVSMVLLGKKRPRTYELQKHGEAPIQNTVIVGVPDKTCRFWGRRPRSAEPLPTSQEKNTRKAGTEAKSNGGPGPANQSDQQAKQGNADQTEPTRHPSLGSWNVMPAVGREQLYLSVSGCWFLGRCPFFARFLGRRPRAVH